MNKKTDLQIGKIILKSVFLILVTAVVSAVSRFLFVKNMFEQEYFSEQVLNVWFLAFFLLILNSFTMAVNQHDEHLYTKFSEKVKNNKLMSHIKFIVSSIDFYIELGCIFVLSLILPPSFLYGFINKIFFYGVELSSFNNKLYTLLIILPIMFVLLFVARIMLQKNWYINAQREKEKFTKGKGSRIRLIVKSVVTVAVIYCGGSMALPWLLPLFITLWNLGGILLFVWILIALAASSIAIIIVYYIRALLKRRSFIAELKKYSSSASVCVSDIKKPYLSLFFSQDGFDFSVEKNGMKYDCKFIAGIFPGSPLILSDKGNGLKQDTIRLFRIEVFSFLTKFDFSYESENKKILILLPTPKTFFVSNNEAPPRLADVGERVGAYTVYNSTGFLGALDRNCL